MKVLEFSGDEREDLPYRKYCTGCRGMFRDTTRSVSREWPERCFPTGHESCCRGECFSLVELGPDGAAGRRGEGAISATPTRPPRPDFGLEK